MNTVTDEEYHLSFGLHSGIPLCCVLAFTFDGRIGGPCPSCVENGVTKEEMFSKYHHCDENIPACQPYLDIIEARGVEAYKKFRKTHPDSDNWGTHSYRPLDDKLRDMIKEDGFLMVHLCWPATSTYWYIFQKRGAKKGKCGICNTKFSLQLPTAGKQHK